MKPKHCTCTGVCLQIPDGSCQRLNKIIDAGKDKIPQFINHSKPKADPKDKELTPQEQLEQAAKEQAKEILTPNIATGFYSGFLNGGLKGMEIQKEIDRQEIERLKEGIRKSIMYVSCGIGQVSKDFENELTNLLKSIS